MAHARLSIIDLSSGSQPMPNEDKSIWTVFNGEIFNYIELRRELETVGHRFSTHSDTETIVHAYEEYGDQFVQKLNGQFAIALWDSKRKRLVLARDRFGIRPLYYAWDGGTLLFASEVKAIRAAHSRGLALNPSGLAQVFTYWGTIGAQTVFKNVRALPAGNVLSLEGGQQTLTKYWDWEFARPSDASKLSFRDAAEELRSLLIDAVQLQLRADVPIGAYLSGGLDSSGIVSVIRKFSSSSLRTFSVAFEDEEFDEGPHQRQMVQILETNHSTLRCTRRQIGEMFPTFVWHAESPVLRTAPVPLMMLSGMVHNAGFKVVLTGEGADEVFGGYDLFKEGKIRRFWAAQPGSRWRPALFRRLYPYLQHSPVGNQAYARNFFGNRLVPTNRPGYAHETRWGTTQRQWNVFSEEIRQEFPRITDNLESDLDLPAEFGGWEALARDQYVEAKTLLEGYLLSSQGDRVAMANSVEGRVPFLDHRIVEFAGHLPARYKIRGLREKAVLKAALTGLLPKEIVGRVKQPYRAPDAPCFFANGKPLPYVEDLLSSERIRRAGYFDASVVGRLVEKCRAGRAIGFGDNMALVGVISTMLLHEQFIE